MHEEPWDGADAVEHEPEQPRPEPTGIAEVDAVVAAVAALGDRPVADHVAVFEQAHTALRAALDDATAG